MSWHQTKHILYHNSLILLFPTADCVLMIIADVKARGGEHKLYSFDILYERTPDDEKLEKNRIQIRPCVPELSRIKVEVYTQHCNFRQIEMAITFLV